MGPAASYFKSQSKANAKPITDNFKPDNGMPPALVGSRLSFSLSSILVTALNSLD
jgi:hypothetical protein